VIVKGILDLASSLGLDVVAEGVELSGQARLLNQLGCPKLQGYLYCRPLPRDECGEFLAAHRGDPTAVVETHPALAPLHS
jgi:EAL domain-containing protein (putative c-di-GMP-specific phosphodiesterase class I)